MNLLKFVFITIVYMSAAFADSSGAQANEAKSKKLNTGMSLIKKTVLRYQGADAIIIQLAKTVTLSLLGETTKSEGQLFMSNGRLRLEIEKPEASLVVMSEEAIWLETPTPKELGGRPQVIKIKSKKSNKKSKAPLAALLSDTKTWDQLKIDKQSNKKELVTFDLRPIKRDMLGEVVKVVLVIDSEKSELKSLTYFDELDNETKYQFKKTDFAAKVQSQKFEYTPPKGAEITEY